MASAAHLPVAFVDEGLGNSSYLLDLGDGRALVVDPARHPAVYHAAAERRGLRIAYALETHLHADFISGARELHALGAMLLAPAAANHAFDVAGLHDGDEVALGGLTLRALATPGHTPEHLAFLLLDGETPHALFSGGSLLVGSVARTDLISPEQTEPLARSLWKSINERVLTLPDDLPVYPTHGAGSFCASGGGSRRTTTIGQEKRDNRLLAARDEDSFVAELLGGFGTFPPYFLRLREHNRRGPHIYGPAEPALPALSVDDVQRHQAAGAWVVDVRPVDAYARGHVSGSVSIALRPQFASWLGWIVPAATSVAFVVDADQDRADLVRQARNIGYEDLLGELDGGIDAWIAAGQPVDASAVTSATRATGTIVDVRQHDEYADGHVPGARHVELGSITGSDAPRGPISVMCAHGERAMTAASLLARGGRADVTVLIGGPDEWSDVHGPLETG